MLQAAACLLCGVLVWRYVTQLEPTEFSGGRTTGPLLAAANFSILLFAAGLVATLLNNRLSVIATLAASLLALPLFLYFTCPGPFRHIFKGNYSVPAPRDFVSDTTSIIAIVAVILALLVSFCNLFLVQPRVKS